MALFDYTDGSHMGGFVGFRVVVQIDGEYVQKYFHHSEREQAEAKNAELEALAKKSRAKRRQKERREAKLRTYSDQRYRAPKRTGVQGLSMGFQQSVPRIIPVRYYPCIEISVTSPIDGKRTHTVRCLSERRGRTLSKTWDESCRLLAERHGLKRVPSHWKEHEPTVAMFEKLRKHYVKNGRRIPTSTLNYMRLTSDDKA